MRTIRPWITVLPPQLSTAPQSIFNSHSKSGREPLLLRLMGHLMVCRTLCRCDSKWNINLYCLAVFSIGGQLSPFTHARTRTPLKAKPIWPCLTSSATVMIIISSFHNESISSPEVSLRTGGEIEWETNTKIEINRRCRTDRDTVGC